MLKKLVALTLAALMLINPMTAMAVSWSSVVDTLYTQRYYNENGVNAKIEEDENGLHVEITSGTITDFYHDDRFASYTFAGSVVLDGEEFSVYVGEREIRDEEDNVIGTEPQQVVVNVESGAAIVAEEVRFGVGGTSELKVNTSGSVGLAVDTETNELVVVTTNVSIHAEDSGKLTFNNEGVMEAADSIDINQDGVGEIAVTNGTKGSMTTGSNVGVYMWDDGTIKFTNDGKIVTDTNKEDVEDNGEENIGRVGIGVWGSGDTTVINGETGVVNGEMTGWLDTESADASVSITNLGTIDGDVGAWGEERTKTDEDGNAITDEDGNEILYGEGTITLNNEGKITGSFGTFTEHNTSVEMSNSGTVGEDMYAHNSSTKDMIVNNTAVEGGANNLYVSNESGATTTLNNSGIVTGNFGVEANDGSLVFNNSGTIDNVGSTHEGYDENDNLQVWADEVNLVAHDKGNLTVNNTGNINTADIYIANHGSGDVTVENAKDADQAGSMQTQNNIYMEGSGSIEFSNSGKIETDLDKSDNYFDENGDEQNVSGLYGNVWEGGSITLTNEASGSITGRVGIGAAGEGSTANLTNNGTTEYFKVDASEGAESTITNNNTVTVQMTNTAGSGGTSTSTNSDGAYAEWMWSHADEGGNVSSVNEGTAGSQGGYSESDNASVSVTNNGTVDGWLDGYMFGNGTAEIINNGDVGIKVSGTAGGEGSVIAVNTSNGTIGDGVRNDDNPPDGLWVSAENGGSATGINDGVINGEIGGGSYGEGSVAEVVNTENGSAETAWLDAHGGDIALNNDNGSVKGTLSVSIGTQSNDITSEDTVGQLLEQTGLSISGYESVDIYTVNQDGEMLARYSVDENGSVKLEEVLKEEDGGSGEDPDDPANWSEERIRHEMEEERKAAEIGGVYGSPYHLKQLYLGYMSLNLRLFSGEDQLLFKEHISWVPGTGKAGEKILTLNAATEDTSVLMMRLDGKAVEKLEQAGIVIINIVDAAGNLFMQYKVEDLKDARAMYGLTEKEYIVVGNADAEVMKIAEDGTISPIEGETEPAAEETPAA